VETWLRFLAWLLIGLIVYVGVRAPQQPHGGARSRSGR
jgi:hypothetical protein